MQRLSYRAYGEKGIEMNVEGMARFEEVARLYLNGTPLVREAILSLLAEDEQKIFLEGVGFYHLFTDERFHKAVVSAMGEQMWDEVHGQR